MTLDQSAKDALHFEASLKGVAQLQTAEARRSTYLANFTLQQLPLEPVAQDKEITLGSCRVRLWRGEGAPDMDAPALLYLHGGGWVIGSPETHEDICRSIANRARAVVFSPDYRLAPEAPFPSGLQDCVQVLKNMASHAKHLGIDSQRIAIGGDSAGGNLAAAIALMARDWDTLSISAQLLIYPVTDCGQSQSSYSDYGQGFGLTAVDMRWFRDQYVASHTDQDDWRASPLRAASLKRSPPAFVALAGCDVLYCEGNAYASRLESEAIAIVRRWPGQIHGFVSKRKFIPEGDEALDALVSAWKQLEQTSSRQD